MARIHSHVGARRSRQRGAALLITLTLVGLLITIFVVVLVNDLVRENTRRQQTSDALARAKEALVGFAVGVDLSPVCTQSVPNPDNDCVRPGDLPCPDLNDDGVADSNCGDSTGTGNQQRRLGRLPWKTLGLPDLRDGDGERLWYAVSNNFKNTARTRCVIPGDPGCLNSRTPGTITLKDSGGTMIHDGGDPDPPSGLVAVIIAPGRSLTRDGSGSPQDRSCSGGACTPVNNPENACAYTGSPVNALLVAKCDPTNYLDRVDGGEDNANFTDGDTFNGFISGPVFASNQREIVNDAILAVKYEEIMPLLERRVAKEAMNCLTAYASASNGRFPWAADIADVADNDYDDVNGLRFGRLPDRFSQTILGAISLGPLDGVVEGICGLTGTLGLSICMGNNWPAGATPSCTIGRDRQGWWRNWKSEVFYGVAEGYQPQILLTLLPFPRVNVPTPAACSGADCLVVNPPSAANDKHAVVIVAGLQVPGQSRSTAAHRADILNYLEGENADGDTTFSTSGASPFNDYLIFQ